MESINKLHKIFAKSLFLGKQVIYLPSCHSTNSVALELLSNPNTLEGTLVVTDEQTAGRGQQGNLWISEAGKNLTFSLILKPVFLKINEQFFLNMAISNALATTLGSLCKGVEIKWPNDLLINKEKVCGVLIENILRKQNIAQSVVGIGINVNQKHFSLLSGNYLPTSLSMQVGDEVEVRKLLESLLLSLESQYLMLKKGDFAKIKKLYLQRLFRFETLASFEDTDGNCFDGVIVDIEASGRLMIDSKSGTRVFGFKEVHFR